MAKRILPLLSPAILLVLLCGCGGKEVRRYAVSGSVSYKGVPVKHGMINFTPLDGNANMVSGGASIRDGHYEIPAEGGLAPGKYRVAISYPEFIPENNPEKLDGGVDARGFPKELLPEKYNRKSVLTATVEKKGPNTIDFPDLN